MKRSSSMLLVFGIHVHLHREQPYVAGPHKSEKVCEVCGLWEIGTPDISMYVAPGSLGTGQGFESLSRQPVNRGSDSTSNIYSLILFVKSV